MKTIKDALLLIVFILIGAVSQTMAQPMNRAGFDAPGIQNLITEYGDELNLTDEQKSELLALQIEHRNQFRQDARANFRRGRDGQRGARGRGFRNADPEARQARFASRVEMRQEVLDILTSDQVELLQSKMIEKAEKAHEFRTFRHQYVVEEAGISGDKAEQVLRLLDAQSESRLELDKQRILNPEEVDSAAIADRVQRIRDTDDQLRSLLTVDEYESLRKNLGFGFGDRPNRTQGPRARRWSR